MLQDKASIIETIKNLLKLANDKGATENEASNAARAASKLLLKYGIDSSEIGNIHEEEPDSCFFVGQEYVPLRNIHAGSWKWQVSLANKIAKTFNCEIFFCQPGKYSEGHLRVVGAEVNRAAAIELIFWIFKTIQDLSTTARVEAYKKQMERFGNYTIGKGWYASFCIGMASRIGERVVAEFENDVQELNAHAYVLARVNDVKYFIEKNITFKTQSLKVKSTNSQAYILGRREGEKLQLGNKNDVGIKSLGGAK